MIYIIYNNIYLHVLNFFILFDDVYLNIELNIYGSLLYSKLNYSNNGKFSFVIY